MLFGVVASLLVASGCGVSSSGTSAAVATNATAPPATMPVTTMPVTTIPETATTGPSSGEGTPPAHCKYGSVVLSVPTNGTASVCLHVGAVLTATFDKSAGGYGGPSGPWAPLQVEPTSVLRVISEAPDRQLLKAVFGASHPGTASVNASFQTVCSSRDTTCTIPPLDEIFLNVTVISP